MARQEPHPFLKHSFSQASNSGQRNALNSQPKPADVPRAPDVVPSSEHIELHDAEDPMEETLDMRFHVEKQKDPNIGMVISDRYKIVSLVGKGGMGVVYKAEYMNIDRTVAIKMLHPHIVADAEIVKRFQAEAQAVSRVEHPHCVRIYDFGMTDQGQPFIVMDFVEGGSLREVLQREGTVPMSRAADIFSQTIEALACAHRAGIIHRDMKPENIMLTDKSNRDWVYVVDFGISTLASTEQRSMYEPRKKDTIGSPAYMSPEQCQKGAQIDHRSDIYSLAVAIYETISGKLPYQARNAFELIDAHMNGQPTALTQANPALASSEALSFVLMQAMEKQPDKRQQTVEQLGEELLEAFKRDTIRSNYLKNRKDALLSSSSTEMPVFGMPGDEDTVVTQKLARKNVVIAAEPKGFMSKLVSVITGKNEDLPQADDPTQTENKIVYANCPRCNDPCEPGISFCLNCGRSLATTHEFAKIRAASGVFALPRSQDNASAGMPVFSHKARAANAALWRNVRFGVVAAVVIGGMVIAWQSGFVQTAADALAHLVQH